MHAQRWVEAAVGLFLTLAAMAIIILAFKVSGLTDFFPQKSYTVSAAFDEIGGLKVRSPVKIGGVQIGEVSQIQLNPETFKANVSLRINAQFNQIPDDSSAGIFTSGLLGDNYVAISPMYSTVFLKNGDELQYTHSAMVLEKLIGQFVYKMTQSANNGNDSHKGETNAK